MEDHRNNANKVVVNAIENANEYIRKYDLDTIAPYCASEMSYMNKKEEQKGDKVTVKAIGDKNNVNKDLGNKSHLLEGFIEVPTLKDTLKLISECESIKCSQVLDSFRPWPNIPKRYDSPVTET